MIICISCREKAKNAFFYDPYHSLVELCPNCARNGQMFPNGSKRNQKTDVKL
ncbi:hypothetical protein D1BOALGB6SA_5510 [Olavius sp. associated proteobacterium Delta 1]|nr:hypothetical protein D1BOALGB6SA_5510 [Olavius sp. associated proteobacterium Delta 1]